VFWRARVALVRSVCRTDWFARHAGTAVPTSSERAKNVRPRGSGAHDAAYDIRNRSVDESEPDGPPGAALTGTPNAIEWRQPWASATSGCVLIKKGIYADQGLSDAHHRSVAGEVLPRPEAQIQLGAAYDPGNGIARGFR
jgi:hypothetical protein